MLRSEIALLVVDDSAEDGRLLEENLAQTGHSRRLHFCRSTADAVGILHKTPYDIILTDHRPPYIDAFYLLRWLTNEHKGTPVVVLTGQGSEKLASEAIKQGAYDYLTKEELEGASIAHILETVLERRQLKEEAQQAHEQLKQMAIQDSLTGVYNRRLFQERLEDEFHRSQRYHRPLSIVLLDVDSLKDINDEGGHLAGDRALQYVAKALNDGLRRVDTVARYGGDEFGIILPETAHKDAVNLAQRMCKKIAGIHLEIDDYETTLTASIGVASLGPQVQTEEDLIIKADKALYLAKESGRNQVCSEVDVSKMNVKLSQSSRS